MIQEDLPKQTLGSVARDWSPQATVVCLAGGPSLTPAQVQTVYAWRMSGVCRVIAINNTYELALWADAHYFADHRWYRWHKDKPLFKQFPGERYSIENANSAIEDPRITVLRNLSVVGGTMGRLSTDPSGLYTAMNSGYQAIGLAVLKGARRIVLLGYDMKPCVDGRHHWHKEHPVPMDGGIYVRWREEYKQMAPTAKAMGIEILNATSDSALDGFAKVTLESVVANTYATALSA